MAAEGSSPTSKHFRINQVGLQSVVLHLSSLLAVLLDLILFVLFQVIIRLLPELPVDIFVLYALLPDEFAVGVLGEG